jgi:hypothetical protein
VLKSACFGQLLAVRQHPNGVKTSWLWRSLGSSF